MALIIMSHAEFEILCINSFRYAISRKTYTVQETCQILKNHIHKLSIKTVGLIKTEIQKALESERFVYDRKEWQNLFDFIVSRET